MHKHIFITGSTDGIGKQTAIELAKADHYVYIHARDKQKADTTLGKIKT
jgi:short-subunit dehydrogenase